ncbi:MAG: hypothetical protein AB7V58_10285 [Solirubrobacterales bacterium]
MAKRVMMGGAIAGMLGGVVMIGLMMIVMGAQGSGYATPLNLGIPAFAKTITPPLSMMPTMMSGMGIHLPADAMSKLAPAFQSGHLSPEMMKQVGGMLQGMHLPAAKMQMINDVMAGHASNSTVTDLLKGMSPSARHAAMDAMPVTAGNVVIGLITHFALAVILGVMFAMLIIGVGIERLSISALRNPAAIVATTTVAAAMVYVVNRWVILPAIDPMMQLAPQGWFFIAHLLFGLVVGAGVTMIASREGLLRGGMQGVAPAVS